jgi:hypothetical protein
LTVQSILIATTVSQRVAMEWLRSHGYRWDTLVPEGYYWHARQVNPDCFDTASFRTKEFGMSASIHANIKAIVGVLRVLRTAVVGRPGRRKAAKKLSPQALDELERLHTAECRDAYARGDAKEASRHALIAEDIHNRNTPSGITKRGNRHGY